MVKVLKLAFLKYRTDRYAARSEGAAHRVSEAHRNMANSYAAESRTWRRQNRLKEIVERKVRAAELVLMIVTSG